MLTRMGDPMWRNVTLFNTHDNRFLRGHMRPVSILIAIVVTVVLYLGVFERDRLLEFAQRGDGTQSAAQSEAVEAAVSATEGDADAARADTPATPAMAGASDTRPVPVVALRSTATGIDSAVIVRGRTEAARQVDVRAETTSSVISEPLRKGAFVSAGQTLCELDIGTRAASLAEAQSQLPKAEAQLLSARAALSEAEINANAASKLNKDGFASETRVLGAQAAVESAKAGIVAAEAGVQSAQAIIAAAQKEIERLTITAPFEGILESDTAELGSLLSAGTACATVIQLDPINLVGFVAETEVAKIAVGARAGAQLVSGATVTGRVTFLSRSADEATRTFRVEVEIANPDLAIRDGETVEIIIASEGRQAHLLPQSSLTLDDDGRIGVRTVAEGDVAQFMPVQVLRDTVDGIWVSGLPQEAAIIVVGQEYVTDGVALKPTYRSE